jgi:hypothetical protein
MKPRENIDERGIAAEPAQDPIEARDATNRTNTLHRCARNFERIPATRGIFCKDAGSFDIQQRAAPSVRASEREGTSRTDVKGGRASVYGDGIIIERLNTQCYLAVGGGRPPDSP